MVAVLLASVASVAVLAFAGLVIWLEFRSRWQQIVATFADAPQLVTIGDPTPPEALRPVVVRRTVIRRPSLPLAA